MMLKDQKTAIIEANRTHEGDTGSPEVQVAILTERIARVLDGQILRSLTMFANKPTRTSGRG